MSTVSETLQGPSVSHEVAARFHSLRRRYFAVNSAITTVLAVAVIGCWWMLLAVGDYVWEWPRWVRASSLVCGTLVVGVWWALRIVSAISGARERTFANRLEHVFGDFGQRIRTVLDSVEGRIHGPQAMLGALGHQTLGRWETLAPGTLVPLRTLAICGGGFLLICVLVMGSFFAGSDWRTAMLRSLGMEVPYTTMSVTPGDTRVLEGSIVTVSLELHGRLNRDIVLRYRELPPRDELREANTDANKSEIASEPAWVETELAPTEGHPAHFQFDFGKTAQSMEYQFLTSVGNTRVYRVDIQPLIEVEAIEITVQPPAYTQLPARTFGSSDVAVLQSSEVQVVVATNHPLHEAHLKIGPKSSQMDSVVLTAGDDLRHWAFSLPSEASGVWHFSGSGRDRTPMTPVKGRLRVRRDAAPRIAWRDPDNEIRVNPLAELPMRTQIADDYGITSAGIVFLIGDNEEYVLTDWEASPEPEAASALTTRLRLEEVLPLESFVLSERDYISYYAFAVDNRDPAPQRVESDIRYIDIRPLRQFFSEIELDPAAGGGGRVLVQLDELIRRQRFLINRTRRMTGKSSSELSSQLGTLDRMIASQSELAGLTRFLTEFLISRGNDDVEALNQAESAMLQAADSLAAASFDLALVQEEDALRALAEARRTLEIFLIKNATPAQQRALQQFARQMQQKLRRERDKTERELADELEKIASSQAQLGEMARRMQTTSSSMESSGTSGASANKASARSGQGEVSEEPPSDERKLTSEESPSSDSTNTEQDTAADDEPANSEIQNDQMDDQEPGDGPENESPQETGQQERQDELFAGELDLLERLRAIEERIQDRLTDSQLLNNRMQEAQASLDELAVSAREGSLESFISSSQDAADQLREMGLQLDGIAAREPVKRVSALRDMTTSLANRELELADKRRNDPANSNRLARQLRRRAETIQDVLKTPARAGDIEGSEVSEFLTQFIEENRFLDQLDATRSAASEYLNQDPDADPVADETAGERARTYVDAAVQLDALYRQLVEPRLARLKAIEKRANAMAQTLSKGGKAAEDTPETKAEASAIQRDLQQEGMEELSEALDRESSGEGRDVTDAASGSPSGSGRFSPKNSSSLAERTGLVARELRRRIQEMILLEVAADRDAPVPTQYRGAVDQYFSVIAGEEDDINGVATP